MKSLQRMVAVFAAIAVTVFLGSLLLVVVSAGRYELAAEICSYSLISSFALLALYQPGKGVGKAA